MGIGGAVCPLCMLDISVGFYIRALGVHNCVGKPKAVLSHTWGIGDKVTVDYGGKLEPGQIVNIMKARSKAKLHITVLFESDDSNAILKTLLEHKLMKLGVPVFLHYVCGLCTME